jgi:flagellar motility protein MotE (MotC chaperone)
MRAYVVLLVVLLGCAPAGQSPQSQSVSAAAREELQRDIKAADDLKADIDRGYKALESDLMAGRLQRIALRERRRELHEKDERLKQMQESIREKRKALGEEVPSQEPAPSGKP